MSNRSRSWPLSRSRDAAKTGSRAIALRVNPDVDAKTHAKISTGKAENKFGIPLGRARDVYARGGIACPGSRSPESISISVRRSPTLPPSTTPSALIADFVRVLRADGHAIDHIDLGGGLGIPYASVGGPGELSPGTLRGDRQGKACAARLPAVFEPGRLIAGNAGILVTSVLFVKRGEAKTFIVVDAAMNDLVRPTLYDAHHEILPVRSAQSAA